MAKTTTHHIRERRGGRSAHRPIFTNNKLRHPLYKAPLTNDTIEIPRVSFPSFVRAKSIDLGQAVRCTGCSSPRFSQKCIESVQIYFDTIISCYFSCLTWKAPTAPHERVDQRSRPLLYKTTSMGICISQYRARVKLSMPKPAHIKQ